MEKRYDVVDARSVAIEDPEFNPGRSDGSLVDRKHPLPVLPVVEDARQILTQPGLLCERRASHVGQDMVDKTKIFDNLLGIPDLVHVHQDMALQSTFVVPVHFGNLDHLLLLVILIDTHAIYPQVFQSCSLHQSLDVVEPLGEIFTVQFRPAIPGSYCGTLVPQVYETMWNSWTPWAGGSMMENLPSTYASSLLGRTNDMLQCEFWCLPMQKVEHG
uniref:Uncharacterized protein n=1 Tax=Bionectria ochroleuca TaxID=29856 RepID=A0A8H7NQX5_BIOOC